MMNAENWKRLGRVLHRLSYLKFVFYLLGIYYQLQSMVFGAHGEFLHNLCSSLFMYGLAMLLEGLRDNELVARKRNAKPNAKLEYRKWVITGAVLVFSFAVLEGLFCFYAIRERFVGEAIVTFGIGGLAFFRLEYDCLTYTLALREKQQTPAPVPAEELPAEPAP